MNEKAIVASSCAIQGSDIVLPGVLTEASTRDCERFEGAQLGVMDGTEAGHRLAGSQSGDKWDRGGVGGEQHGPIISCAVFIPLFVSGGPCIGESRSVAGGCCCEE